MHGDVEIQQAVRFGLFHILQAGARAEHRPIPAKGLTGTGYDGHTFWDTEAFVLPVLTYTKPDAAADALSWRNNTLPIAREHAKELGLAGAAYAWRTIHGEECSGYWPAGTAAFHINADIAEAVVKYCDATQDADFEREVALPILVETARLWRSLGQHDGDGKFRIEGVTGPDEYSAVKDNNVYTNLMAQANLTAAADFATKLSDEARKLDVSTEEAAAWRDAAADMYIPYDERLGVHPQHDGFTHYARWDFELTSPEHYPLLLHYPYFQLYRKQVVKQADLVLAMQVRGDAFTPEQKLRNFDYYEALTVRDSSLSACTQAVMAAEVGHLDLAYDYLAEAAFMDLQDREHNTRDGLHIASLAGAWTALVGGFGGMRTRPDGLSFVPRLPPGLAGLTFRMRYRGRIIMRERPPPRGQLRAAVRGPAAHHPPRQPGDDRPGHGDPRDPAAQVAADPGPAARPRPAAPQQHGRLGPPSPRPCRPAGAPPMQPRRPTAPPAQAAAVARLRPRRANPSPRSIGPGGRGVIVCRLGRDFRPQASACSVAGAPRPEFPTMTRMSALVVARGDGEDGVSTPGRGRGLAHPGACRLRQRHR